MAVATKTATIRRRMKITSGRDRGNSIKGGTATETLLMQDILKPAESHQQMEGRQSSVLAFIVERRSSKS